jgi:hypothetical protein
MDDQAEAEDIVSHFLVIIYFWPAAKSLAPFRLGLACVYKKLISIRRGGKASGSPQQSYHIICDFQDEPAAEIEDLPRDDASARHNQSNGLQ